MRRPHRSAGGDVALSSTRTRAIVRPAIVVALAALALSCQRSHLGADASIANDAGPPPPTDELDLLVMMDDSDGTVELQVNLGDALPTVLEALSTGDLDGDGAPDRMPFTSIHLGVVSSDMGAGGFVVPSCGRALGDDGLLQTLGHSTPDHPCSGSYPPFLTWSPGIAIDAVSADFDCVEQLGVSGCGFEQPLEAPLKALSPSVRTDWTSTTYVAPAFFGGPPHGDRENDGFVRADSLLAVVIVTDEDDCSASDLSLYDLNDETHSESVNLRCLEDAALHPIERYVDGLLQLRRHPSRLAFSVIAGLPPDLEPMPGAPIDWDVLAGDPSVRDPRMVPTADPSGFYIVPSCNLPGLGTALPPARIARVARELAARGARVSIGSECQESYATPIRSFLLSLR